MDELDRDARAERPLAVVRDELDQQRPQPLAAGVHRGDSEPFDEPGIRRDDLAQPQLHLLEIRLDRGDAHAAVPVCSATIPPASRRKSTSAKPCASISAARVSGPGKRRTLAGR